MIYTVTLNPALDKTVEIPAFTVDGINRIVSIRMDPGGTGINVSKVVAALGSTSRALGILGGSTGQSVLSGLAELNMVCDFLPLPGGGSTRVNLKVLDPVNHTSTEIIDPGAPVEPATLNSLLEHLLKLLHRDDIVVLAGSLPVGTPADTYRIWCEACAGQGARVILDSDGPAMAQGILARPYLIKPNSEELSRLVGRELDSREELAAAARELVETGIGQVVVTMGSRGMLYVSAERTIFVHGLRVPVKDSIGAGDAVVAAMAVAAERALALEDALRLAAAAGAASVMCTGTQAAALEDIERLMEQVSYREA